MYRIAGLSIILKNDFIKKDFKMDNTLRLYLKRIRVPWYILVMSNENHTNFFIV